MLRLIALRKTCRPQLCQVKARIGPGRVAALA